MTLVFSRGGHVVGRIMTDTAGRYRIRLAPARYLISLSVPPRVDRKLSPDHARVSPSGFTRVDLSIDTGIR